MIELFWCVASCKFKLFPPWAVFFRASWFLCSVGERMCAGLELCLNRRFVVKRPESPLLGDDRLLHSERHLSAGVDLIHEEGSSCLPGSDGVGGLICQADLRSS